MDFKQHVLDRKLITEQVRWIKFAAILGAVAILIGGIGGPFFNVSGCKVSLSIIKKRSVRVATMQSFLSLVIVGALFYFAGNGGRNRKEGLLCDCGRPLDSLPPFLHINSIFKPSLPIPDGTV